MPSPRGARQFVQRIMRTKEENFGQLPAIPVRVQIRAPQGGGITPAQEMYPDERWVTSQVETFAGFLGAKTDTVDLQVPFHHDVVADHGDVLETALGEKRAGLGALTLGAGSTVAQVTYTGAVGQVAIGDILKITLAPSGQIHFRPVKQVTAAVPNIAILALQLAPFAGGDAVSAIANVSVGAGAQYKENAIGVVDTYQFAGDQDGEPDTVDYTAKACVPTSLLLSLVTTGRTFWAMVFSGAGYAQDTDGNIADASDMTGAAVQWSNEIWIDPNLSAPGADPQPKTVNAFNAELAPLYEMPEAFKSRTGTALATIADTPGIAWRRMKPFSVPVNTKMTYAEEAWITAHEARTQEQIFIVMYGGQSGAAANGDVVCVWFPQCRTAGKPQEVWDKQIKGHQIPWQVEHNLTIGTKCVVAIFRGA